MEGTGSGEDTPNNYVNNTFYVQNDIAHEQQRSSQDMTNSNSSSYHIERRQLLALTERQRIHSMTREQRQSYLARRRSNYHTRRIMDLTSSNSTSSQHSQRINWRLTQRNRRHSMNEETRNTELARRRAIYQRRRQNNESSTIPDVSALANIDLVEATTRIEKSTHNLGQNQAISYRTFTSNFERGSTSAHQPPTHSAHQGMNFNEDHATANIQRDPRPRPPLRPRRYHNLARNFSEFQINYQWQLPEPSLCIHCQALLFHGETSQLCCRNGNTKLDPIPCPVQLQELYSMNNEEGKHFRQFIRAYNHVFSFTSMGVNIDHSLATGTDGIYTFRVHGSIYHSIGSLLPDENCRPRYMQMWIVDTNHDINNKLQENPELRPELLIKIQNILDEHNPFVHVLRQIGQREDIPNCRLIIRQQQPNEHQYSLPTASQVAAVIVDNQCDENLNNRDIIIQGIGGDLISIQDVVGYYDPLQYPLLLPHGTYGWDINSRNIDGTRLTCLNDYVYILQIRQNLPSLLLRGGRLLQQYVVDNYVKIETQRLRWIRSNQREIRSELYQGLQDCLHGGENNTGNVGTRIVLPSSFGGSPRDMYQRYQDAMTLVQTYGKPDIMLTMTCNPNWNEIKYQLLPGQSPQDRPDLITRIFRSKFEEFKKDVVDRGVLGKKYLRKQKNPIYTKQFSTI